jgi:hypothetical protein
MAIKTPSFTVGVAPTLLTIVQTDAVRGATIEVRVPVGGVSVWVGGADVGIAGSATEGDLVEAGARWSTDLDPTSQYFASDVSEELYGIVAAGTQRVTTFQRGV